MTSDRPTYCPRCGKRRLANHSRSGDLCRDCWLVEPQWPDSARLEVAS